MWAKVIFSDEPHFKVDGHRSMFGGRSKGEPVRAGYIQQAPKNPPKKMFGGTFSVSGPGRLILIAGTMNREKYKNMLETPLLHTLQSCIQDGEEIF